MPEIKVALKDNPYNIYIGSGVWEKLPDFVRSAKFSRRALVVSDTNVAPLYGERVIKLLTGGGLEAKLATIEAGEASKSLSVAETVFTAAIEAGLDRRSAVFALGGGVVGDLAGFVAASFMRGVPFVQIPTSLLADVDSSVGGKVAVNHRLGKNLIGAFYQPQAVFIDLDCLATLPKREIGTGLGEIVKYGIISDAEMFAFLENNADAVRALEEAATSYLIARSCGIKADVVCADERDTGLRRILNFGHTLAHAIETETNYCRYNHGEAVAVGIIGASFISRELGLIDGATFERIENLVNRLGLPTRAAGCTVDNMYADIFHDKKTVNGVVNWVLTPKIGATVIRNDVPEEIVKRAMEYCLE